MIGQENQNSPGKHGNINIRVTDEERWAFKTWCAEHRMSQVDAFRQAFQLLKDSKGDEK